MNFTMLVFDCLILIRQNDWRDEQVIFTHAELYKLKQAALHSQKELFHTLQLFKITKNKYNYAEATELII